MAGSEMTVAVTIRREQPMDFVATREVNLAAFPEPAEADLVEQLRVNGKATISLVAVQGDRTVGHILFSPATVDSSQGPVEVLALGPMAVVPEQQGRGVGSLLVTTGLKEAKALGYPCVVVLGHPSYYPRFGFRESTQFGVTTEYDVPAKYFMLAELEEGALQGITGLARYQPEFAGV